MALTNDKYFRAFSSLGCAELELDEVLQIASHNNIEAVELRALGDSIDLIAYFERNFETPQKLADHIALSGIRAIALDALHTWNLGGESPRDTWNAIHESVAHIHVKDAVPGKDMKGTLHTLPGNGSYPMAELRDVLRASDYRGALSLEWARKWHTYLPTIETALIAAKSNRWW